jgi:hypothetical protein
MNKKGISVIIIFVLSLTSINTIFAEDADAIKS